VEDERNRAGRGDQDTAGVQREVVQAHLRRIEAVNPSINAVVTVLGEQALEAAKAADRAVAAGGDVPPFHGVPFTIKDHIDVAGTPTTQGLKALVQAYPTRDAPIVERMKAAGAIPIGRTNLPSGAVRWHCDSELWGATINPWDRTRTPGASSAGEAAAIATGMSPLGQRRYRTAALCGVPMVARTSRRPVVPAGRSRNRGGGPGPAT